MTCLRATSVAAILSGLAIGAPSSGGVLAHARECDFQIVWRVPPPTIANIDNVARRVDLVPQDTPIRIVAVELSRAKVTLDVVNVTDQTVKMVHPWVQVLKQGRPVHKGGGPFVKRPLASGERLRLDVDHEGVLAGASDDGAFIQVSMSMVDFGGCMWRDGRWTEAWRGLPTRDRH